VIKEYGGIMTFFDFLHQKQAVERELPPIVLIAAIQLNSGHHNLLRRDCFNHVFITTFFARLMFIITNKEFNLFFGHTLVNITLYCCLG
jgi:hypothetical protein